MLTIPQIQTIAALTGAYRAAPRGSIEAIRAARVLISEVSPFIDLVNVPIDADAHTVIATVRGLLATNIGEPTRMHLEQAHDAALIAVADSIVADAGEVAA